MTRTLWPLQKGKQAMEVLYECCCGVDIHLRQVCACLLKGSHQRRQKDIQTFGTTTAELRRLAAWLQAAGCTHIAMESTGVYTPPRMVKKSPYCQETPSAAVESSGFVAKPPSHQPNLTVNLAPEIMAAPCEVLRGKMRGRVVCS